MARPLNFPMTAAVALSLAACLSLPATLGGCAERQKKATIKDLKNTSEGFVRRMRWGDYKGMTKYMVPEQRLPYVKGILERGEDDTLKILDCEMEHVHYVPPGDEAIVLAKISWYRLPSVTALSEVATFHLEDRDGEWLVSEVENGPLPFKKVEKSEEGKESPEVQAEKKKVAESFDHL